jgi:outer membrane receptor protein involved in Fe transport
MAEDATMVFQLPAEPLNRAVIDYAMQANVSVGDSGVDFRNARSNPVFGSYTRRDAMQKMLAGTGFDFEFLDESTVVVRIAASPAVHPETPITSVIVTATKREERANSLPYSLWVGTGDQIENLGIHKAEELSSQVAGFTTTNLGTGEDKLFLRGLTDSVLPGLSESMVGLYLDEGRVADDAPNPDLRLVDIDRIEVIRGPQGTLYGAGSLAGLVRIITRKPDLDALEMTGAATLSDTQSGGRSASLDAVLNLPIVTGKLALRLVGYVENDAGYIDERRLDEPNSNRSVIQGGRGNLLWQPNADWSISTAAVYQEIKTEDSQYFQLGLPPLTRDNFLREPYSDYFLQASVTVQGSLGWADLVSASTIQNRDIHKRFDASLAWPDLTGDPLGPASFDEKRAIRSYTHETRLASKGDGPWQWLVGFYVAHRDEDFSTLLLGPDSLGQPLVARLERREDHDDEFAGFGEVTYAFNDLVSLTAGLRGFIANRAIAAHVAGSIIDADFHPKGSSAEHGLTPKVILKYQQSQNMLFYAQISEGYRLGGINIDGPAGVVHDGNDPGNTFDSDVLWNFEVGSKTDLFDGKLHINSAVYYEDWRNVQTDQLGSDGSFFVVSAGTVEDFGFEIDAVSHPIDGLSLSGNFFWNLPELIHPNPLLLKSEGSLLPGAPNLSFGVTARYDVALTPDIDGFAGLDYSYVGRSHLGFDENSPPMGGYQIVNLRVGALRGDWESVLFVNNLFDEGGNTFAFGNPFDVGKIRQSTPPRPRTVGLQLVWRS